MWGNSEFGIQNSERFKNWRFFSDGFWAFWMNLDSAFYEISLQKNFWRKEYEKS